MVKCNIPVESVSLFLIGSPTLGDFFSHENPHGLDRSHGIGIWMFPKIVGFPPKSSILIGVFPLFSPSILGVFPLFLETPI